MLRVKNDDGDDDDDNDSDDESDNAASGDEKSDGHEGDDIVPEAVSGAGDTRRIRSFENGEGGIGKWFDRERVYRIGWPRGCRH